MRKFYSGKAAKLIALSLFFILPYSTHAQVLINESFENVPAGWTTVDFSSSGETWNSNYSWDRHSGHYCAASFNYFPADNWLFSPAINMIAGKRYVLNFWYQTSDSSKFRVALATGTSFGQQTQEIFKTWENTGYYNWKEFKDTITAEASGVFYIGFQNGNTAGNNNFSVGIYIDDVTLTQLNFAACNNSIEPGIISASVAETCNGASFILNNAGATFDEGIRYAWQSSSNGMTWTNITNGYELQQSCSVILNGKTYYRFVDTCLATGISKISNVIQVTQSPFMNCFCTPPAGRCTDQKITRIAIAGTGLNNASTSCTNGYTDFTSVAAPTIYNGSGIELQYTVVQPWSDLKYQIAVWIDYNHNGSFDPDEFTVKTNIDGTSLSGSVAVEIPATAINGNTRMRVRYGYNTVSNSDYKWYESCENMAGEIEDYTVNIQTPANCSGLISAGSISGPTTICPNTNFTITNIGATTGAGNIHYAWQSSLDGITWKTISQGSALQASFTTNINATSLFRFADTCIGSSLSAESNIISVVANNILNCNCKITGSGDCSIYRIDSVRLNSINHAPVCSANGYGDYTSISTTLNNGSYHVINIRYNSANATLNKNIKICIDYNRDGILNTNPGSRELIGALTGSGQTISIPFIVPFDIKPGEALMRIVVSDKNISDLCINPSAGQIIDYKMNLATPNPLNSHYTYYVRQNAPAGGNGFSWSSALQEINAAFALATIGDTIKVSKGVYKAATTAGQYLVPKDSMVILGGYPDTGSPTDAQRDFVNNQTVISGEIGTPDISDNLQALMYIGSLTQLVIDGFVFEKANNAYASSYIWGPIGVYNSTFVLRNSVIRNNHHSNSDRAGGAALKIKSSSVVSLENVIIESNKIDKWSHTGSLIRIENSSLNLSNCVIAKNSNDLIFSSINSTIDVLNSTLFKNEGYSKIWDTSHFIAKNSIFYNNGTDLAWEISELTKDNYSSISVSNTLTEFINPGTANFLGGNPMFRDTASITGADGKYFTADDGLHLTNPCSPAINAGNDLFVVDVPKDITGAGRIKNGAVDLGAYELQETIATPSQVIYVKRNATGLNNGTSWANAFTDLQKAFSRCGDTIKVAQGIYPVSPNDRFASFVLQDNKVVIGGYTGNMGDNISDPEMYKTILDGTLTNGDKVFNVVKSYGNNSTAKLIGVEIRNTSDPWWDNSGRFSENAALNIGYKSSPVFENVTLAVDYNSALNLVRITGFSNPKFLNSKFYNGNVDQNITIKDRSAPVFYNCYLGKDTLSALPNQMLGAGIAIDNSQPVIDSSCFFLSRAEAISITNNSNVVVKKTVFEKTNGRSIGIYNSFLQMNESVFKDLNNVPTGFETGGTIGYMNGGKANITDCKFYVYGERSNGPYAMMKGNCDATYTRCFFDNRVGYWGGMNMRINGSHLTFKNCVLTTLMDQGFVLAENGSRLDIINSTLVERNWFTPTASYSISNFLTIKDTSKLKLYNSILWRYGVNSLMDAVPEDISMEYLTNKAFVDIRNSFLFKQPNTAMTASHVGINPKLVNITDVDGPDNKQGNADDGYMLCNCSPAINAGNNSLTGESLDFINNQRIYSATIDAGAYEVQTASDNTKIFYVNENAAPNGNGKSWLSAFNSLQKAALNNCAEIIKVSQGIYKPAASDRDSSFNIYRGISILGGYPKTGSPKDSERNPILYPTILSGDIGVADDSTDNSKNVLLVHAPDTLVTLDGLIIERGNGSQGAGLLINGTKRFQLLNSIVRKNNATNGGGIYTAQSNVELNKSIIANNTGNWGAGANFNNYYTTFNGKPWSTAIKITNSVFEKNISSWIGGGFQNSGGGTSLINTVIYKNEARQGAGVYSDNSNFIITNCSFVKNNSTDVSNGIGVNIVGGATSYDFKPYCYNSLFLGNTMMGGPANVINPDLNFATSNNRAEEIPFINAQYNSWSGNQNALGWHNMGINDNFITDLNDGDGPDNIWLTADDGIRLSPCSPALNAGLNSKVENVPMDILGNERIQSSLVDLGAYEGPGQPRAVIIASDTTLCAADTITFTANTTFYDYKNTVYQWYRNGAAVGTSAPIYILSNPANNDHVFVKATNPCSTDAVYSDTITVQVGTAIAPLIEISASQNNVCSGTPVSFTGTFTGNLIDSSYQWMINGKVVENNKNVLTTSSLSQGDIVTLSISGKNSCGNPQTKTSNSLTMHILPNVSPDITVTSSADTICANQSMSFNTIVANGGANLKFQWFVNGIPSLSDTSNNFSIKPKNEDQIQVVLTSSETCVTQQKDTSNKIKAIVHPVLIPSVSIIASADTICAGMNVSFTATPVNGGKSPAYQWLLNGNNIGGDLPKFESSTLSSGDIVKLIMKNNALCATDTQSESNAVNIYEASFVKPSITLASNAKILCQDSVISFVAVRGANLGTTPVYQWLVNGNIITTSIDTTFSYQKFVVGNNTVAVKATSAISCASPAVATASLNFNVKPTAISTVRIPDSETVTTGESITVNATLDNPGTNAIYQWQDSTVMHTWQNIAGATDTQVVYTPKANSDKLRLKLLNDDPCVFSSITFSNSLLFIVNDSAKTGERIYIYPNPAGASTNVVGMEVQQNWNWLEIFNAQGKRVSIIKHIKGLTQVTVDLSNLPSGTYFIALKSFDGKHKYLRFIKE
ncbi:MAG: GEVED domain-containing protein [Ginsengibacter sp.]